MAAATGYDGPNDEQLHAYADLRYADLPFYGSNLAEVFAVRVPDAAASSQGKRLPPCGMVCIAGAYSSQSSVVFARSRHDDPVAPQPCDWQGNLVLTGPGRAISADGPVGSASILMTTVKIALLKKPGRRVCFYTGRTPHSTGRY
ncbi:unnamed protein product [Triticum turgidum subsp. durum]|uniref:Uncharacterized protein n=1 Tax=Triticum turgidum subsp. durum TaxID=4567 RepID=A0A9R0ZM32_TRITD|nr:unnamed protein product [Triticum turgidum subsp. durum]